MVTGADRVSHSPFFNFPTDPTLVWNSSHSTLYGRVLQGYERKCRSHFLGLSIFARVDSSRYCCSPCNIISTVYAPPSIPPYTYASFFLYVSPIAASFSFSPVSCEFLLIIYHLSYSATTTTSFGNLRVDGKKAQFVFWVFFFFFCSLNFIRRPPAIFYVKIFHFLAKVKNIQIFLFSKIKLKFRRTSQCLSFLVSNSWCSKEEYSRWIDLRRTWDV